jgi:hypothetical protein
VEHAVPLGFEEHWRLAEAFGLSLTIDGAKLTESGRGMIILALKLQLQALIALLTGRDPGVSVDGEQNTNSCIILGWLGGKDTIENSYE